LYFFNQINAALVNSPVLPRHVLFSCPALAVFHKVMKMSWISKNC